MKKGLRHSDLSLPLNEEILAPLPQAMVSNVPQMLIGLIGIDLT